MFDPPFARGDIDELADRLAIVERGDEIGRLSGVAVEGDDELAVLVDRNRFALEGQAAGAGGGVADHHAALDRLAGEAEFYRFAKGRLFGVAAFGIGCRRRNGRGGDGEKGQNGSGPPDHRSPSGKCACAEICAVA